MPSAGSSVAAGLAVADGSLDASAGDDGLDDADATADADPDGGALTASVAVGEAAGLVQAEATTSSVSSPERRVVRAIG